MEYGYCRISRKSQKIERQIQNIKKDFPNAIIFQEAYTGTKITGRKEFNRLLSKVTFGDTIIFDSVSRMSRNAEEGISLYFDLFDKGCLLYTSISFDINIKECRNTSDTHRRTVLSLDRCQISEVQPLYRFFCKMCIRDRACCFSVSEEIPAFLPASPAQAETPYSAYSSRSFPITSS